MSPSFQQQLSAYASLLTSPSLPHFSSRLASSVLTLTASQKHTASHTFSHNHSYTASHSLTPRLCLSHSYTASCLAFASHSLTPPHSLALLQPCSSSGTRYSSSFSLQNFYYVGFRVLYTWFCCMCCLSCGYAINSKWVIVKVQRKGLRTSGVCTINRLKFVVWVFLCLVQCCAC